MSVLKKSGYLKVTGGHKIYWEEYGKGKPVVILHGGPGAGIPYNSLAYFNLNEWRVIVFDQRGCGKSKPFLELKNNTTYDLINDIEKLRKHLKIQKWVVFGGSWGSTLAIAYGQEYPKSVESFILRSICLFSENEIKWFFTQNGGPAQSFPREWKKFIKPISNLTALLNVNDHIGILKHYRELLWNSNKTAIKAWNRWEYILSFNKTPPKNNDTLSQQKAIAIIENYYFLNKAWLKPNQLLKNISRIKDIPCTIIHGKYDNVCPVSSALKLKKKWIKSKLIITNGGHSASENAKELKDATTQMLN